MSQKHLLFKKPAVFLLFLLFGVLRHCGAQTTLSAGDIAFTGYNATVYGNNFSFVLLKNISAGTSINFTDIGWNNTTLSLVSTGTDAVFTWTSSVAMPQFTEVTIAAIAGTGTAITSLTAVYNGVSSNAGTATNPNAGTGGGNWHGVRTKRYR